MDEDDAFLSIGRRISCSKGTCACIGVALAGSDSDQYRAIFDEAAAAKRVRLPRRQRQEVNFGTVCTALFWVLRIHGAINLHRT